MSATFDKTLRKLNDCGCCEGVSVQTPSQVYNRPGLKAIAYRAGVHEQFKETMLARLSATKLPDLGLKTRENEDFSIALLDSWAAVCDVLTFYQERIANEFYLKTATERRSVLELARTIGYELNPGVAANAYLAFEVDESPGSPPKITIDKGLKVQSTPGPGELPQTIETIESIEARAEWNAMRPRMTKPQIISASFPESILVEGTSTNLKVGDMVLIADSGKPHIHKLIDVVVDQQSKTTRLEFPPCPIIVPIIEGDQSPTNYFYLDKANLTSDIVKDRIINKIWRASDLEAYASAQGWNENDLSESIRMELHTQLSLAGNVEVYAMCQRAALFGYNAPNWNSLPDNLTKYIVTPVPFVGGGINWISIKPLYPYPGWEDWTLKDYPINNNGQIYLDNIYSGISEKYWIILDNGIPPRGIFKVDQATDITNSDFTLSAKVTKLDVRNPDQNNPYDFQSFSNFKIRGTMVFLQSEHLHLAEVPILGHISGNSILLDSFYIGLRKDQIVIITGERCDLSGNKTSELAILLDVTIIGGFTKLIFQKNLANQYIRNTVTICANVVLSTHGETVTEVLGNGDARQPYQNFALKQSPLTYISSQTPSGSKTTLQVRVNDLLWHEVSTLCNSSPKDHVYVTRTDDDGKTTIQFGDGKRGARLPSGQNNVSAIYRKSIGLGGLVKAGQINLLMSRPLGLKDAVNPLPSSGAQDRQTLADARRNAPLTVLTLDRAVSLQDYEDYARAFAGVAKALATWTWNGERRAVLVTIAGPKGYVIKKIDATYQNLLNVLRRFGDPYVSLMLSSYRPVTFRIRANVKVNLEYQTDRVFAALEIKLRDYFSFEARNFGQSITLSEVITVMQNVPGVMAVSIMNNDLYRTDGLGRPGEILKAAMPKAGEKTIVEAELLTLDPAPIDLKVMA
jgi:hypothetical protein